MQQLYDIYFKYQILLFYLFPTFLELQIYSQEQILQIFSDYLTISQEPLQICEIWLDMWIPMLESTIHNMHRTIFVSILYFYLTCLYSYPYDTRHLSHFYRLIFTPFLLSYCLSCYHLSYTAVLVLRTSYALLFFLIYGLTHIQ